MVKTIARHGTADVTENFFSKKFISGEKCRGRREASSRHAMHRRASNGIRAKHLEAEFHGAKSRAAFCHLAKIAIVILKDFAIVMLS